MRQIEATKRPRSDGLASQASRRSSVQSVERALDLFELLVGSDVELGMRQMSEELKMPVATVHRLLSVLVSRGYARQSPSSRRYGVGFAALELAGRIRTGGGLRRHAQPYLRELVHLTGESANLGRLEGGEAVYVAQAQPPRMMRLFTEAGNRVPFHACAIGKVLAAFESPDHREWLLLQSRLARYTESTITDPEVMRIELSKVRNKGYALDEGEYEDGVRCVAVPVLDRHEHTLGALSVSGPAGRISQDRLEAWVPRMQKIAAELADAVRRV